MPSKQQNTRQSNHHHHAHTISRATNLNHPNYPHHKQYQSNQYAATNQYHHQYHQFQPTNYNSSKQQLLKSSQTLNNYNYNHNNGSTPVMNPYYYSPQATNNNYESLPLGIGSPIPPQLPPPPPAPLSQAASMLQGDQYRGAPIMMHKQLHESLMSTIEHQAMLNRPLCRCRVMYLGSSVPHITKNGLHGIQEPLRHLYPEEQFCGPSTVAAPATKGNSSVSSSLSSSSNTAGCQSNTSGTSGVHSGSSGGGSGHLASTTRSGQPSSNTIDISHLSSGLGIDSWLSVWSNGLLLENFDEFGREVKRFFSIESLHYCAAVRFFDTKTLMSPSHRITSGPPHGQLSTNGGNPDINLNENPHGDQNNNIIVTSVGDVSGSGSGQAQVASSMEDGHTTNQAHQQPSTQRPTKSMARFLPLDAPLFQCPGMVDTNHPPVFAAIMRRTTGIKVLECHAFICRRDAASNALVRCCTQAYADLLAAKRLSLELGASQLCSSATATPAGVSLYHHHHGDHYNDQDYNGTESRYHRRRTSRSLQRPSRRPMSNHSSSKQSSWSPYESVEVEATINNSTKPLHSLPLAPNDAINDDGSNGEDEDNSLEVSSEDNYAIISKHHYNGQQQQRSEPRAPECSIGMQPKDNSKTKSKTTDRQQRLANGTGNSATMARQTTSDPYRSKAGSSKSLYPDFMPKAGAEVGERSSSSRRQSAASGGSMKRREKMSHSVDLIEQLGAATCCRQEDEDQDNNNGRGSSVKYSLVGSKRHQNGGNHNKTSKRHSRSMQNLDGPYEFSAIEANRQSQRRRSRHRRSSKGSSSTSKTLGHEDRRSVSYNDISDGGPLLRGRHHTSGSCQGSELMIANQQQQQLLQSSSSKKSLPAGGGGDQPVSFVPVIGNNTTLNQPLDHPEITYDSGSRLYGELGQHHQRDGSQSRRHRTHSRSLGQQADAERHLPSGLSRHGPPTQEIHLVNGTNGCEVGGGSRRTSSKHGASRRRDRSSSRRRNASMGPPQELAQAPISHQQQPAYFSGSHLGLPAPYGTMLGPTVAAQQQQPQYYPQQTAPGLYHLPYYLPPVAAAAAYHHNPAHTQFHHTRHQHPHFHPPHMLQQQQPIYGPPPHFLYNPSDPAAGTLQMAQLPGLHYSATGQAVPGGGGASGFNPQSYGGGDRKSTASHSRAAKALASGFRCLSPPMNFLSALKRQSAASEISQSRANNNNNTRILESASRPTANGTATKQATTGSSKLPPQPAAAAAAGQANVGSGSSIKAIESQLNGDHQESHHPDPAAIVSARPGFLLSSTAAAATATSTSAPNRDKKMSWIKRLSLTMSASPDPATSLPSPTAATTTTTTTNGLEQRERKKRSSLFSGSLTIGRRSRQQRQQQPHPNPNPNPNGKMVAA